MTEAEQSTEKEFHVSFVYTGLMGGQRFEEFNVRAEDEEQAIHYAEHRAEAPDEYDDVTVREVGGDE